MSAAQSSILLLGESGVGKTHYGAQLLKRLMKGGGVLRMNGAATNLTPFEAALERLNEGQAADHTATATYADSIWPVADADGRLAELIWPDYGGEQIKTIIATRRAPSAWRARIEGAPAWLLMIRLQQTRVGDDIFTRPLAELRGKTADAAEVKPSDQARLVEFLQMLLFIGASGKSRPLDVPCLGVLLTCWDELGVDTTPPDVLDARLPLLAAFIRSNWRRPLVFGLSALERPFSPHQSDMGYVTKGPESFGFVVTPEGVRTPDLTLPIQRLLTPAD